MENYKEEINKLQTQLDELKSKIEKPINKPNNWYKSNSGHLKYFTDETNAYGFRSDNLWIESQNGHTLNRSCYEWTLATKKEVEEALTKEAVKRYKDNNKVKCLLINSIVTFDRDCEIHYDSNTNSLFCGKIKLFNNGIWTTPIKTLSLDYIITKISNDNNANVWIKENKQEIIETLNNL